MLLKQSLWAILWLLATSTSLWSQQLLDLTIGTSFQDNFVGQVTLSHQFSSKFRAGLGVQYGAPKYRFVGAKPFQNTGYSSTFSIPLTLEIARQDKIQLFGLLKLGARFQGVIDPDDNDQRDSILESTAVLGEVGFLVNIPIGERVNLQSGVSFPIVYEVVPAPLLEYQWTKLHVGASYALSQQVLFLKGSIGSAFGASGDTYKFLWTLQAGIRFQFGESNSSSTHFIETSF